MLRGVLGKFRVMARRQGRWPDLVRRRPGPNKWQADSVAAAAFHRVPRKLPTKPSSQPEPRERPPRASPHVRRSEEHTSELQSLMRTSYAVFCLNKKNKNN